MLKIRTFILALTLTPVLALNWQQPGQSQTFPSTGQAGSMSGAPSMGSAGSMSGNPSLSIAGGQSGNPSLDIAGGRSGARFSAVRRGSGKLLITTEGQNKVNRVAVRILTRSNNRIVVGFKQSEPGRRGASDRLTQLLANAGVRPGLGRQFTLIFINIFRPVSASTTPSFRSVQLPQKDLVASTKALKESKIIAQVGDDQLNMGEDIIPTVEVDINELNNAINTYNQIIDESSPVTLQALSQNQDFMEIGNALKELRAAVN
ncbi:MAG: hypothetical protein HEQ12_05510 [Aphanizomenon flos-aquae DEX188]|nr:MAG: hypothetical protein HEQ12_05510 [Aphanizomenon flos-aquae DEX188]